MRRPERGWSLWRLRRIRVQAGRVRVDGRRKSSVFSRSRSPSRRQAPRQGCWESNPLQKIALNLGNAELEFALTAAAITFLAMLQQPLDVNIDAGSRTTKPGQARPVLPA
jgi:hypothetical protein